MTIKNRILFISEAFCAPFDEGIKNVVFSIYQELSRDAGNISVTKNGNFTETFKITKTNINKLFMNYNLGQLIRNCSPETILYLPEASLTFNSFIRAKVLKYMNKSSKVVILGVKPVEYSLLERNVIRTVLKPDMLLLQGRFDEELFSGSRLRVRVLPPAVDHLRFCQATDEEKRRIRKELNIPDNKTVVLHVGHVRKTRNVQCFSQIQKMEGIQVFIVGSTSTPADTNLKDSLANEGVRIMNQFIPDIEKIYKMSDIYVFPLFNEIASIRMPLSVLEAMACNLPVITTKFGALENNFQEDSCFRYFDSPDELAGIVITIQNIKSKAIHNSEKVEHFTWARFANEIIAHCSELL